jgi:hypothetical protein
MKNTLALSAAAIALLIMSAPSAQAAYVVDLRQVADRSQPLGSDLVATGSGTLDLAGLPNRPPSGLTLARINGSTFVVGPPGNIPFDSYATVDGPFEPIFPAFQGPTRLPSSGSGDIVGIFPSEFGAGLDVPQGYVSGDKLSTRSTFDDATFASLGLTPGVYRWTWGATSSVTTDGSFTLIIGVPEPSTWAMMALGFGLIGGAGYWRRRSVAIAA